MSKDRPPKKLREDDPPKEFCGDQEQLMRFFGAVRKIGASNDVFDRALRTVAMASPLEGEEDRQKNWENRAPAT